MPLTHINEHGYSQMVSVEAKEDTLRVAIAKGSISVKPDTFYRIQNGGIKKGDVLSVAQVAGIMASKKTSELIPMCHPLMITGADIEFEMDESSHQIHIKAIVKCFGKTGVEMEALTAVSVAALTIYDMCKAIDKDMVIGPIALEEKRGGKSGDYIRGGNNEG